MSFSLAVALLIAVAVQGSSAANVTFCANKISHPVTIKKGSSHCKKGQARWVVASGDVGATGAIGPTGSNGVDGAKGAAGAVGAMGAIGPTGATGVSGPTGATGAQGVTGAIGPTGATGATGTTGAKGATGNTGPPSLTTSHVVVVGPSASTASVTCNSGALMGGGASGATGSVTLSGPLTGATLSTGGQTPNGWQASVDVGDVSVYAICSGP